MLTSFDNAVSPGLFYTVFTSFSSIVLFLSLVRRVFIDFSVLSRVTMSVASCRGVWRRSVKRDTSFWPASFRNTLLVCEKWDDLKFRIEQVLLATVTQFVYDKWCHRRDKKLYGVHTMTIYIYQEKTWLCQPRKAFNVYTEFKVYNSLCVSTYTHDISYQWVIPLVSALIWRSCYPTDTTLSLHNAYVVRAYCFVCSHRIQAH